MIEHLETINHREAILFIEELDKTYTGKYRSENIVISAAKHIPPKYYEVGGLMQKLIAEYQSEWEEF